MGYIQLVEMEEFPPYYAHSKVLGHSRVECHILNPQLARILPVLWLMGWKWMWVIKLVKMRFGCSGGDCSLGCSLVGHLDVLLGAVLAAGVDAGDVFLDFEC
ncbi:hypothetical protein IEQ34_021219 [Dendrobium chrysotoxum]|uniref:Uncharacterized protein n=1 Tax=Dendrobium chrysotoxum TaxID=161865 RepID=A0AAV7G4Y4_DENCH|nr:hypothetical protein IEQ34_021219 [Dendrobium chrysotoxum]